MDDRRAVLFDLTTGTGEAGLLAEYIAQLERECVAYTVTQRVPLTVEVVVTGH